MQTNDITPTLAILVSALKVETQADSAMQRAADNSLRHFSAGLPYEFDGSELRIVSESEARAGVWVVTDGVSCTCKGGRHSMCKHRALFRLLLAREVLLDPQYVRARIIEQVAPVYPDEPPPPEIAPAFALNVPDDDWYL